MGNISLYKTVRIKFSVDSGFSIKLYDKTWKPRNAGNQSIESFLNQKALSVNGVLLENCEKAINLLSTYHFGLNNRESQFQVLIVRAPWYLWAMSLWEFCLEHTKCLEKLLKSDK